MKFVPNKYNEQLTFGDLDVGEIFIFFLKPQNRWNDVLCYKISNHDIYNIKLFNDSPDKTSSGYLPKDCLVKRVKNIVVTYDIID